MANLVEKHMQEPKDDLISKLVVEQVRPGHIDSGEAVQMAFLLLVAGNATMVNMIALVCLTFNSYTHPICPPSSPFRTNRGGQ